MGDRGLANKFVEHENAFYQLQKNYVYRLKCELFRYEDEVIDTGIDEIDDTLGESYDLGGVGDDVFVGRTQTMTLIGSGTTATASVSIVNGGIRYITVTNRGGGYKSTPRVIISAAPSSGSTGIATAVMIGGIVVCNDNVDPSAKSVQEVQLVNPGYGYTVAPGVKFDGGEGSGASAVSYIGNGILSGINLLSFGSGYSSPPRITFGNEIFKDGVESVSAAATAVVSSAGTITSINITNAGLGYSIAPSIIIDGPVNTGVGTYKFNEIISGSTSGSTARVRSWNAVTNELEISNVTGTFLPGERIVGTASSASYSMRFINENAFKDGYSDNDEIEREADLLIDFSESNPFGTP